MIKLPNGELRCRRADLDAWRDVCERDMRERPDRRKGFEVRWTVNGREKSESFLTKGLAESRRAKLMTAAREGEPFDTRMGLPASNSEP